MPTPLGSAATELLPLHLPYCPQGAHSADINSLRWEPSGKLLASCSDDGTVKIWDPRAAGYQRDYGSKAGVNAVALHPNQGAPTDSTLIEGRRNAHYDKAAYTRWLQELRQVCTDKGIALIFDEVFLGFRLGVGGAQAYFGVRADMVTYGKTLGGGLPIGVLCGEHRWMKRFDEDRPGHICFSRGTFNAHPQVMGSMKAFLKQLDTPEVQAMLDGMEDRWQQRLALFNARLQEAGVPVRVEGMLTVWTILYTIPSRYHWMLQYYLRKHRIALSWVGTGRMIFSLNFTDADFDALIQAFVAACREMQVDGWWWQSPSLTTQGIKRQVLREMMRKLMNPSHA